MYYFVSLDKLDISTLKPRVPHRRAAWENDDIPRICVSDSLEGCLTAIPANIMDFLYQQDVLDIPLI